MLTDENFIDVPTFPMISLPPNLRQFVQAAAESVQVSPDMFALPLLGVLAGVFQRNFKLRIDADYCEPLSLYTITVAPPSERKTAIMNMLEAPVWDVQNTLNAGLEDDKPHVTLYTSDTTPEKLAVVMAENNGVCAIYSDEPDVLATAAGLRYGRVKNLMLMLQAWSDGHILIQRMKDNRRIVIDHARLSIAVMSQPSFIRDFLSDKEIATRGLSARFLYAQPPSMVGSRRFTKITVPKVLAKEYYQMVVDMLQLDGNYELTLSDEARAVAETMFNAVESMIQDIPDLESWMGKLFGQIMRIAGVLHCAIWQTEAAKHPVEPDTVTGAAAIGVYLKDQAKALYAMAKAEEEVPQYLTDAKRLLDAMKSNGAESWNGHDFSKIAKRLTGKRREDAIDWLIFEGLLSVGEDGKNGKTYTIHAKKGTEYEVN